MAIRKLNRAAFASVIGSLAATLCALPAAAAPTPYYLDFDSTSTVDVSDVAIFNLSVHSGDGYTFTQSSQDVSVGSSALSDGIALTDTTQGEFMIGLVQEPSSSPTMPAQTGIVIFGNDNFGELVGKSVGQALPGLNEATLISWLQDPFAPSSNPLTSNKQHLEDFANTYATLFAVTPGQDYSEIEFSNGQVVGSGTLVASATPLGAGGGGGTPPSATPEPNVWALMIGGVALAGAALRRRWRVLVAA